MAAAAIGSSLGATSIPLAIGQMFSVVGPRAVILLPGFVLLLGGVVLAVLKCGRCNAGVNERDID